MSELKRYARTCAVILMVGVFTVCGSSALGAGSSKPSKTAPIIEKKRPWLAVVYSVAALAGISVVAFKNPKRTHSD